jgi:ABC-type amino acid transport substrate-binding protein
LSSRKSPTDRRKYSRNSHLALPLQEQRLHRENAGAGLPGGCRDHPRTQVAFVLSKGDKDLKDGLDAVIATLHQDGSIAAVLKKAGLDPDKAETGAPGYL